MATLPTYQPDREQWRRQIYDVVNHKKQLFGVKYTCDDRFELVVLLYLDKGRSYNEHDLDNLIKDVFDSLQGFVFDKGAAGLPRIIPNDNYHQT